MKLLPYIFILLSYFAGWFTKEFRHTCPNVERIILQYPTRNEMLEFLRQYKYKGTLDGEIGTGGNKAWERYELDLMSLEIDGDKYGN